MKQNLVTLYTFHTDPVPACLPRHFCNCYNLSRHPGCKIPLTWTTFLGCFFRVKDITSQIFVTHLLPLYKWDPQGVGCEEGGSVGCNTTYLWGSLTFRRNISPPCSELERKVSKKKQQMQEESSTLNMEVTCASETSASLRTKCLCNPGYMFGKIRLSEIAACFISLILGVLWVNQYIFIATLMINLEAIILWLFMLFLIKMFLCCIYYKAKVCTGHHNLYVNTATGWIYSWQWILCSPVPNKWSHRCNTIGNLTWLQFTLYNFLKRGVIFSMRYM